MLAPYRGAARRASRVLGRRIRIRLFWVLLAFGTGAGSSWYYKETIFALLLAPAGGNLSPFDGLPIFTSPVSMMSATIQLAMRGGFIAALPVLLVSIYTLLSPLVAPQQRRFLSIFLPATVVCFLCGIAFAYFVMLPTGLRFLLNFGTDIAVPVIVLDEYISLLTAMMLWLGVVFEIPVVMFLFSKLRIVSYLRFSKLRKYVPVSAFVLSAILTPTFDIVNQSLLALPMIFLYEVGLFVSWLAWPEEGNYLFIKTIRSLVSRIVQKVQSVLARALRRIQIVVGFPVVKVRWAYRKVLRKE